jgi:hypothetical protein
VAYAAAVDGSGNVFVTGYSYRSGGTNGDYADYATIAYSGVGLPLWTNRYNAPKTSTPGANALAVDRNGNVFVTGGSSNDCTTIAYSAAGAPLWTNRYNGPGYAYAEGWAIGTDGSGNVFVTGFATDSAGGRDYLTIKYSSSIPYLGFQRIKNQAVLRWTNAAFGLQSGSTVNGTFTNIPGATSPYTNPIIGAQRFFRLKGN